MSKRPSRHRPRSASFPSPESDPRSRKLHTAAFEVLSLAVAELTDPRLDDARLAEVVPNPDDAHLLAVIVAPVDACDGARDALAEARSFLRRELATELNRKRAPDLAFLVVPTLDAPGHVPPEVRAAPATKPDDDTGEDAD